MKPKPVVRLFILLVVASASLMLYASSQQLEKVPVAEVIDNPRELITERVSSNEYIFFESLNKLLSMSLPR
jgi:hypothetical protein